MTSCAPTRRAIGLARKYRGQFQPTKLGEQLRAKPVELWKHIASRLPLERGEHEQRIAHLLLLLVAAGEGQPKAHLSELLDQLTSMIGLRLSGGGSFGPVRALNVVAPTSDVLEWAAAGTLRGFYFASAPPHVSAARLIARAALQGTN